MATCSTDTVWHVTVYYQLKVIPSGVVTDTFIILDVAITILFHDVVLAGSVGRDVAVGWVKIAGGRQRDGNLPGLSHPLNSLSSERRHLPNVFVSSMVDSLHDKVQILPSLLSP